MKKSALCIALVLSAFTLANAQKANVNKVSNMLITEPINYEEARSLIAEAKEDPTTADDAKTWYVAGRIGYQQAYAQRNMLYLQQPSFDATIAGQGLDEMFLNYVAADQRDGVPDKKGKIKYKQRKKIMGDFKDMLDFYSTVAIYLYQDSKYDEAYNLFYEYVKIIDLPMFAENEKTSIKVDSLYNQAKYFAALAAIQAQKVELAMPLLEEIIKTDYKENIGVYVLLANQYLAKADTAKYVSLLNEAIDRYPTSADLIGTLVNFYVDSGDYAKAIQYLDELIAGDPTNTEYLGVKAELLTQQGDFDAAKQILNNALETKQGDPHLTFLLGRTWAFEGDHIQEVAMDLTDNDAYKAEMAKANECYATALNFLEAAKPIMDKADSRYYDLLQNMKVLYLRLQNQDKYNEIDAEMNALGQTN